MRAGLFTDVAESGPDGDFTINIEANHTTLAAHSCSHELQVAAEAGFEGGRS
jgi:xylose isomerase